MARCLGSARRLRTAAFAGLLVLYATVAAAEVRQVVLLQSFERGNLVLDEFTATLRAEMSARSPTPVTFTEFVVNPSGFRDVPEQAMVDYLRAAFAKGPRPELVITTGGIAARFVQKNRQELFPDVPVLYGAVDHRFFKEGTHSEREAAISVANDPASVVEDIRQLLPDTEHIFVIMGAGALGRFWRPEIGRASQQFERRIHFIWSDGMSYAQMLQRASTLPARSAVFFISIEVDAQGATYSSARVLADLRAKANAPIFGAQTAELGYGLMGGNLIDIRRLSDATADAALRVLSGTPPAEIRVPVQRPGPRVYDGRELERWGVDERRLPPGSVVLFREPGVWERSRWLIVGGGSVLLVQAALIAALLVHRARRQRAEQSLRESEGRFRVLANSAPVMIRMSDPDARSIDFNVPWLDFTGRTLDAQRGDGWLASVHPEDLDTCRETHRRAFERREPYRLEYRLRRADGEYRWLLESGEPRFTPDGSYAGHIGSAIDLTELKAARATLSSLNRRLIEAQEQERSRVARELHDDVCQRVAMLGIFLQQLAQSLPDGAAQAREQVRELLEEVRSLGSDVNGISHRLHSSKLGILGLAAAAGTFCEEIAARHHVTVEFVHENVPPQLRAGVGINLFRVLQEALANAIKHSGATRYRVRLEGTLEAVRLTVVDDGCGFDPALALTTTGLGLLSMQERLRLIGGELSIESAPGAGTKVRAWVPHRPDVVSPVEASTAVGA